MAVKYVFVTGEMCIRDSSEEFVKLQNKINQICEDMATTDHLEELMEEYQQTLDEFNAIDDDFYESNIRKQLKLAGLAGYEEQLLTLSLIHISYGYSDQGLCYRRKRP